jgi:hypothetical protein
MTTVKQVKRGEENLSAPIYKKKSYVILNKDNVVLDTINTAYEVKNISSYYDDCEIQVRQHDLYLNDNSRIAA